MSTSNNEPTHTHDSPEVPSDRREFVLNLIGYFSAATIACVTVVPAGLFVFNYLFKPEEGRWVRLGAVDSFNEGETVKAVFEDPYSLPWDRVNARRATWLRRVLDNQFIAFAINCTHLGCPIRWEASADLFFCPCHGGVFYSDGKVAAGPPPRPLHQYPVRINDGHIEINVGPVLTEV